MCVRGVDTAAGLMETTAGQVLIRLISRCDVVDFACRRLEVCWACWLRPFLPLPLPASCRPTDCTVDYFTCLAEREKFRRSVFPPAVCGSTLFAAADVG